MPSMDNILDAVKLLQHSGQPFFLAVGRSGSNRIDSYMMIDPKDLKRHGRDVIEQVFREALANALNKAFTQDQGKKTKERQSDGRQKQSGGG